MQIIRSIEKMQQLSKQYTLHNNEIGFVPTMGYFHEGHLSLMQRAKKENDIVITSIFVNPLQFGPNEDFDEYPRDEKRDIERAEQAGVDILFMPEQQEMYPQPMLIQLSLTGRTDVLCGRSRPGHFDGVITVLTKLFHIVQPNNVYFGLKDAQQVAVVDALITDLNFPINLIGSPTVREKDGLAKSSRNIYLDEEEREQAVWLYKALKKGQQLIVDGEQNPVMIVDEVTRLLKQHTTGKIDYVEVLNFPSLQPVTLIDRQVILAIAITFGKARLIDNLIVKSTGEIVEKFNN
ncbi:MAG TPA: pantoate--beta-alanine ligase [Bacillota bacterium]